MRFSVVALAAAGLASAQDVTNTITSTMTKTLTLTACADGYSGCPLRHTSTAVPVVNTTTSAAPKWNVTNSTSSVYCPTSTGAYTTTQLPVTTAAQSTQPSVPAVKPSTGAAAGVTVAVGAALAAAFAAAL